MADQGMVDIGGKVRFMPYPADMLGWQLYAILQPGEHTLVESLGGGTVNLPETTWIYIPEPSTQIISGGEPRPAAG